MPRHRLPRRRQLPHRPRLAALEARAEEQLRTLQADDAGVGLGYARQALASEYGFEGWGQLAAHVARIEDVQQALPRLDAEALVELLAAGDWRIWHPAEARLVAELAASTPAVLAGLVHPSARVRARCAGVLDHGGDARCGEPLRRATRDEAPGVRAAALHALACGRCKREPLALDPIPVLLERLEHDPSPKVRRTALGGLWLQPPDRRCVPAIERWIEACEEPAGRRRVEKLLRIHLQALPAPDLLARAAGSPCREIRLAAIRNLERHPTASELAEPIASLAANEPDELLRRCLARAHVRHASAPAARPQRSER